jgi:ABC-type multidrug transport system fused ATPase/permease subunit
VSAGFAAVALSSVINLSGMMSNLVMVIADVETSISSVERIRNYERDTPREREEGSKPPVSWPEEGRIEIKGLEATYRCVHSKGKTREKTNVEADLF